MSGLSLGGFRPWRRAWFAPLVTLLAVYALFVFLAPETFGPRGHVLDDTADDALLAEH